MTAGKAFLTSGQIQALSARSTAWGLWLITHAWGVILLSVLLFRLWPHPLSFVLAVVVIGSRQLGLAILMHEAAHNALFPNRHVNQWVGEWLCGRPIIADLPAYRHYHLRHHRYTQTADDPDLPLSAAFPTTRASLRRKLTRDITGQTGIKLRAAQIAFALKMAGETDHASSQDLAQAFEGPAMAKGLLANAVLFLILWAVSGVWWGWFAFWLLPLLTWFQLVLRIRNIAEHGVTERSSDPLRNTRTTKAGWIERALLAPYWVNYHLEHHLVMHIPGHNLPKMHRMLAEQGVTDRMITAPGYLDVLRQASSASGPLTSRR